jgi:hypothetical protein
MADCQHNNRLKLFIIRKDTMTNNVPDCAGYFICLDCDDYVCTGWVWHARVWAKSSDTYAMRHLFSDPEQDTGEHKSPIEMYRSWIRDDLLSMPDAEGRPGEVLPP